MTPLLREQASNVARLKVRREVVEALIRDLGDGASIGEDQRAVVTQRLDALLARAPLSDTERAQVRGQALDELLGYGPIQPLLDDPEVTEVMVNGPDNIYVEKQGRMEKASVAFDDHAHVHDIIDRIVRPLGRRIGPSSPTVDARLPDGSRVNAVVPPVGIDGPTLTIRKFRKDLLSMERLVELGSLSADMAEFLRACVISRLSMLISGGTGSGKTTFLNVLSQFIPATERIVTVEDAAELQLQQDNLVRLESHTPDADGGPAVTIRDLVRNALRMRPDRIVVGECRGGEALDMLQAMNTGHNGSLSTVHANTARDAVARLETMVLMAGIDFPIKAVRQQIAAGVDVIVQQSRLRDGSRKITSITEITGMEGDVVVTSEIFRFEQTGASTDEKVAGQLRPTGIRPQFSARLEAAGFKLRPEMFGASTMEAPPRRW